MCNHDSDSIDLPVIHDESQCPVKRETPGILPALIAVTGWAGINPNAAEYLFPLVMELIDQGLPPDDETPEP